MADKYQNKYRIPSARARWWDYRDHAPYFVTICTARRRCFFGDIIDGQMHLSEIGQLVQDEWLKTPGIRPDMNLTLDEFTVMPNHFHGIIIIGINKYNHGSVKSTGGDGGDDNGGGDRRDAMHGVSTPDPSFGFQQSPPPDPSLRLQPLPPSKNKFGPQYKNLASILRGFKSAVTTNARVIGPDFGWQARFHDHIIRNDEEFQRISHYIRENPRNWNKDRFFTSWRSCRRSK